MRLTVETGPLAGTVIPLDRQSATTLGSGPECSLRIEEAGVATAAAVVKALKDEGFGIKALAPGVRLNGAPVEAAVLRDGDVIELGTTRVAFGQVQRRGLPQIPGYRILGELGRGGMGMVYRAEQVSLHREVALKVLNHELTKDPAFVAKFVAEARAAAKLQHPNVVQVFDVEHDAGTYYYAMELMSNGSLEGWLRQHGAMPVERALQVIADAAAGLAYAESLRIVHRDIKPDNLMLDQHEAVKIADLGLAGGSEDGEEKVIGTPHFMAPEQVLRRELDHRTDLYALGCTFYRLVTGRTPFRGQTVKEILRAQLKDEAEPAHKLRSEVPVEVSAIIQRLMAKEPKDRYQSANDLLAELQRLLQPPAKKGLWIGLAAVAVAIAGGAIYWAYNKPKEQTIIEKYRDNPEMLRLAQENEQLQAAAREDQATIALLRARADTQDAAELVNALDRIATTHAGSKAANEAKDRAATLRRELAERQQQREQQAQAVRELLASRKAALAPLLQAQDYGAAEQLLQQELPPALVADTILLAGIAELQQELQTAATKRLEQLQEAVTSARTAGDEAALQAAMTTLQEAAAATARWPVALQGKLPAVTKLLQSASEDLARLRQAQRESTWQEFRRVLAGPQGIRGALQQGDLPAAAAAARQFASEQAEVPAGQRALGLVAILELADSYAKAFQQGVSAGQVLHRNQSEVALQVLRWEPHQQRLVLADTSKKPIRETVLAGEALSPEVWLQLTEQVAPPAVGSRECFLACQLLQLHATAAQQYLRSLQAADDGSGTGNAGYPLSSQPFTTLLARLPEGDDERWVAVLRSELLAGQRLAAGLRALSERRNLAAAGHLDKLHSDHPNSYVLAVLQ